MTCPHGITIGGEVSVHCHACEADRLREALAAMTAERDAVRLIDNANAAWLRGKLEKQDAEWTNKLAAERMSHFWSVVGWIGVVQMRERQRANQESKTQRALNEVNSAWRFAYVGMSRAEKFEEERDAAIARAEKAEAVVDAARRVSRGLSSSRLNNDPKTVGICASGVDSLDGFDLLSLLKAAVNALDNATDDAKPCSCWTGNPQMYEGPSVDCPQHGDKRGDRE